jgi:glycosyltransferase involved in cell wall biosynthesis
MTQAGAHPSSSRLRVAAGLNLPRRRTEYGHGKVWVELLRRLAKQVDLKLIEPRYLPRRLAPVGRRLASVRKADVWLINGDFSPPAVNGPAVVIFHEVLGPDRAVTGVRSPVGPKLQIYEQCMRVATRVITPSRLIAQEVIDAFGFPPERIDAIPYGVDVEVFRPGLAGGRQIVASAGRRAPAPYVLFGASLLPRKNLSALREAMAILAGEGFPQVLAIVAAPSPDPMDDQDQLNREAEAELPGSPGRVVRVPWPVTEDQMATLMAGADAVCVPSLFEGFGLMALEALACGAPTVVSARGSLPEVIGDAGIVVEPTPDAIAAGLRRVFADPDEARHLGAAARRRAESMTWDHTAAGWVDALSHAANDDGQVISPGGAGPARESLLTNRAGLPTTTPDGMSSITTAPASTTASRPTVISRSPPRWRRESRRPRASGARRSGDSQVRGASRSGSHRPILVRG